LVEKYGAELAKLKKNVESKPQSAEKYIQRFKKSWGNLRSMISSKSKISSKKGKLGSLLTWQEPSK